MFQTCVLISACAIQARKELAVEASEQNTRDKILSAACEVFAEQGFEGATIRDITERAGVNVAAVNYHFRDKAELYTRVVTDACSVRAAYREAMAEAADSPEERLRSLIHYFLEYLLDPARPDWKRRLMAREMTNPTAALDELVDKNSRPLREEFLYPTLRELTGGCFSRRQLSYFGSSIMGSVSIFSSPGQSSTGYIPTSKSARPRSPKLPSISPDFRWPPLQN